MSPVSILSMLWLASCAACASPASFASVLQSEAASEIPLAKLGSGMASGGPRATLPIMRTEGGERHPVEFYFLRAEAQLLDGSVHVELSARGFVDVGARTTADEPVSDDIECAQW